MSWRTIRPPAFAAAATSAIANTLDVARAIKRVGDALLELHRDLRDVEIIHGRRVVASFNAGTTTSVAHKLGRAYVGAIILDQSDTSVDVRAAAPSAATDAATSVDLVASGTTSGDVDVWVF